MDISEGNVICRLCLKKLTKENCEPVEEILQHSLNFLTLCPNLTISDDPMMCETCAVNLKKCFDFKARCLSTEDGVASFAEGEDKKVDLRDIYSKIKLDANIDKVPDGCSVCRFCLELVKDDVSTSVRQDIDLVEILEKYFPEMDLRITDDIIACRPCYNFLRFHVSFVNNYASIEEKINEYCRVEGANYKGQVDLRDVATFTSKSMLNAENISSLVIKEEKHEHRVNTDVDVKVKVEDSTDVEEEKEKLIDNEVPQKNNSFQHHPSSSQSDCVPQLTRANPAKYKCDLCNYEAKWKSDVKRHMLTHKTNSEVTILYKCKTCAYEAKHKDYLKQHELKHKNGSEIDMHKCEVCPFQSRWYASFRRHLLSHRNTPDVVTQATMYKCDLCDYEAEHKWNLKEHLLIHKTHSKMYKCDLCDHKTKWKFALKRHMQTHQTHSENTTFKCETCTYETKWKPYLQSHILTHKTHSEITLYNCYHCDYKTKWKCDQKRHMLIHKTHSEVTMYKCDLCEHKTMHMSNLKRHMLTHKTHSETTMYKCEADA